ncbi:hypothetical protein GCM10029976_064240 [Kribbella albertanoniae]|uniref:DUF4878 domain-containing protein n=1 Tax=Kribbella albertanoniae TaxID=1266829 RepID=A0A4R4Q718_9ACTN|nr:hypothetical protein [Kribbella albertanoniae]TDC31051.1 hypothetical protein E1261_11815 [Kribbella albertanoniae]
MKVLLATATAGAVAVVIVAVAAAAATGKIGEPSGAETPQAAADSALHALATQDEDRLNALAERNRHGRKEAARRLIDNCRGSDFTGARVTVARHSEAGYLAMGTVTVPQGRDQCREFTLSVVQRQKGWFLELSTPEPGPNPTAATNR